MKNTIPTIVALALTLPALATDRLVPSQYPTIQAAIDAAANGDTVVVSQGNTWAGFTVSGKSIIVRSESGFARTKVVGGVNADPGVGRFVELNDIAFMAGVSGTSGELRLTGSRHINSGVSISQPVRMMAYGSEFANGSLSVAGSDSTPISLGSCHFTLCTQAISTTRQLITLENCTFDSGGRAINSPNGKVIANGCSFGGLTVGGQYGACYVASGLFSNCAFTECRITGGADSAAGGAIFAINDLTCIGSTFTSCSVTAERFVTCGGEGCTAIAEASGGAIRCGGSSRFTNCIIQNCFVRAIAGEFQCASGYFLPRAFGGAIRVVGSSALFEHSVIAGCTAIAASRVSGACGSDEVNPQALGGAAYLASGEFNNCEISGCTLLNELNGSVTSSGPTRSGSAIYGAVGGSLSFSACRFNRNGPAEGTAVAAPNFTMSSCIVISNGIGSSPSGSPCLVLAGGSPYSEAFFYDTYFGGNSGTPKAITTVGSGAFAYLSGCYFCGLPSSECSGYWFQKSPNYFGFDCSSDCQDNGIADAYEIAANLATDCNQSGVPDSCEVLSGSELDINGDGVPDSCQCIADISGDNVVNGSDLGLLLTDWGPVSEPRLRADLNADGAVNGADLGLVLEQWGPCPN